MWDVCSEGRRLVSVRELRFLWGLNLVCGWLMFLRVLLLLGMEGS